MLNKSQFIRNLLLLCFVALSVVTSKAEETEWEKITHELQTISEKLDANQKAILQRLANIEKKLAAGSSNSDNEAREVISEINALRNQGKNEEAKNKVAEFMKKYGSSRYARSASKIKDELEVIGKESPQDWRIEKWLQGQNEIDIESNAPTVLVFWEVWCPYCKKEAPKLQEIYDKHKEKGLQLVGLTKVNKSATEEKVMDFVLGNGITYPIAKEDGSLTSYFNVTGVPAAAVLHNGVVVWRGHPSRLSDEVIIPLLQS